MRHDEAPRHPPAEEAWSVVGPAGTLEALLRPVPEDLTLRGAALLCHPHPEFGGSLANKVLYRVAKRLPVEAGVAALRLNFRGVGASEGQSSGGPGETEDARAALVELGRRFDTVPLLGIGYSFGAAFGLRGMLDHPRLATVVALGLPLVPPFEHTELLRSSLPLHVVQGERDEFGASSALSHTLGHRTGPTTVDVIAGANHLFVGQEDEVVDAVVSYLDRFLDENSPTRESEE